MRALAVHAQARGLLLSEGWGRIWTRYNSMAYVGNPDSCPNSGVPTRGKIRIAIADDHPIFRDGLSKLLSLEKDFEVVGQAEDGLYVSEGDSAR